MKKIFFTNKLTATFAVAGILALVAGCYYVVVAIFHLEPYLGRDEKFHSFLHYGGDTGILILAMGIVLIAVTWYRAK